MIIHCHATKIKLNYVSNFFNVLLVYVFLIQINYYAINLNQKHSFSPCGAKAKPACKWGVNKMYYFDYAYTGKGTTKVKTKSGTKVKKAPSCKNRFHYITRTAHYKNHKDNIHEKVEYVKSGNMPVLAFAPQGEKECF